MQVLSAYYIFCLYGFCYALPDVTIFRTFRRSPDVCMEKRMDFTLSYATLLPATLHSVYPLYYQFGLTPGKCLGNNQMYPHVDEIAPATN